MKCTLNLIHFITNDLVETPFYFYGLGGVILLTSRIYLADKSLPKLVYYYFSCMKIKHRKSDQRKLMRRYIFKQLVYICVVHCTY